MLTVFEPKASLPNQFKEQFIDDARRLQNVFRPFPTKKRADNFAKVRVNKINQRFGSIELSFAPFAEQQLYFSSLNHNGWPSYPDAYGILLED